MLVSKDMSAGNRSWINASEDSMRVEPFRSFFFPPVIELKNVSDSGQICILATLWAPESSHKPSAARELTVRTQSIVFIQTDNTQHF